MTRLKQDSQLPFSQDQVSLLEDIKKFLSILHYNNMLSHQPGKGPRLQSLLWEVSAQEHDFPPFELPLALKKDEEVDISLFSNSETDALLKKLQTMQILPDKQPDLRQAIFLLEKCRSFTKDYVNALILNTVFNAKVKGWNKVYTSFINSKHPSCYEIQTVIVDYLRASFFPRLLRAAKQHSESQRLFSNWTLPQVKWQAETMSLNKFGILILCEGKDIADLAAFSDYWHAPEQQSVLQALKITVTKDSTGPLRLVDFNPYGAEGFQTMRTLRNNYAKYIHPEFSNNFHRLSHLSTISLIPHIPGKTQTIELNLSNGEELAQARMWNTAEEKQSDLVIVDEEDSGNEAELLGGTYVLV